MKKLLLIVFILTGIARQAYSQDRAIEPWVTANKVTLDSLQTDSTTGSFWWDGTDLNIWDGTTWVSAVGGGDVSIVGNLSANTITIAADTSATAVQGKIVFQAADSSFYGCRSTVAVKKWYKFNP